MGTGKSIEVYTTCEYYSANTEKFIKVLSEKLDADFITSIFDKDYNPIGEKEQLTKYNKPNKYILTVIFDEYTINNKIIELPTYELILPIKLEFEKKLEIEFCPNNAVYFLFMLFDYNWGGFIQTLQERFFDNRCEEYVNKYRSMRPEYISILRKLDIDQICIMTDAHSKTESVCNIEMYNTIEFSDILKVAKEEDKLTAFDFHKILKLNMEDDLYREFYNKSEKEIMLIDNLIVD